MMMHTRLHSYGLHIVISCIAMACIAMVCILKACKVMAYIAMACIVMACIVMAYEVIAYTVMAREAPVKYLCRSMFRIPSIMDTYNVLQTASLRFISGLYGNLQLKSRRR